ncbi:MAG: DNA polymerase I [Lachnospiraceae bacterium]|nr:DNA polymerase I [Lachnospiraceae bacterium]
MSEKIVLIDGHSILHRAFFGIPDLTNAAGLHTNAVYGFLNIMFKILEEEKPEYFTVAFDVHAPTFRHKMYEEYKGTRKPMAEELRQQVPVMKDVLRAMGVTVVELEGYEADDILGTIASRGEARGLSVVLVSGDRDLLQLASQHIKIRIPKTKRTGTEIEDYYDSDVKERYQVTPKEFIDVKALMGDTADNIPGVPGIGEKTATNLIVAYGSIENAYGHVEEIKPNRAKESLKNHYDMAQMSKVLATIDTNCPLEYDFEQARLGNLYTQEAYLKFKELEFKQMMSRFEAAVPEKSAAADFVNVTRQSEAQEIFAQAADGEQASFLLAADGGALLGLALSYREKAYFFQVGEALSREYLCKSLEQLAGAGMRLITLDLKSQLGFFSQEFLDSKERNHLLDVQIGAYLLNPLKNEYPYEDIAKDYCGGRMIPSRGDLIGKMKLSQALYEQPEAFLQWACYCCQTADLAWSEVWRQLGQYGMQKLFETIEMPLVFTLYDMEQAGVLVRVEELKEYGQALVGQIAQLEQEIWQEAGEEFNINSPKQLGVILFDKLNMPNGKKTKTGYSTAADVLEKLAPDYPIVSKILFYRQLTKLKSTYADGLANYIREDGRIHSNFNQTITATGRISSTEPNLQNIPIRVELGRMIRKVFVPAEGFVFVDADYSQIELRVLAHMSGDENLIEAYRQAQDIHRITASQVFHIPFEEVTDLQRRNAKAVNFGIVYGISSFGLSQDLSITKKEAQDYIERYFHTYPGIKSFLDGLVSQAKEKGCVTTMFGRRRPVPEISSGNFAQRSFGERIAMNSPIQGTAADIIKIAMIRVNETMKEKGMKSRLILQVHDELLVEAAEEELSQVEEILHREMESAAALSVALEIDMNTGKNWYDAH